MLPLLKPPITPIMWIVVRIEADSLARASHANCVEVFLQSGYCIQWGDLEHEAINTNRRYILFNSIVKTASQKVAGLL